MNPEQDPDLQKRGDAYFVRDPESDTWLELKGYGALKGMIEFDPRIDLTKPIYEQVLAIERADKAKATRKRSSGKKPQVAA